MFSTLMDNKVLQAKFSDLEIRQLPFATVGAINDALFSARDAWQQSIGQVFDRPTQLTLNAVLYTKATKQTLYGELYLRNEARKGTPPSRYLLPQVKGGTREDKPFEYLLRKAGILGADEYVVPARGFPLDAYGNVPAGVVKTIISDLQATRFDASARSTPTSRRRRSRRKDVAKRAIYFESAPNLSASQGKRQHLPRAIYQRTSFALGSSIRMVFIIVKSAPSYSPRFDAIEIANKAFRESFPVRFKERLRQGVLTAKIR